MMLFPLWALVERFVTTLTCAPDLLLYCFQVDYDDLCEEWDADAVLFPAVEVSLNCTEYAAFPHSIFSDHAAGCPRPGDPLSGPCHGHHLYACLCPCCQACQA